MDSQEDRDRAHGPAMLAPELLDLQFDTLVEIAGHLDRFRDLLALQATCKALRALREVSEVTVSAIANHGTPLLPHQLKQLMLSSTSAATWREVTRTLLCVYEDALQGAAGSWEQQDWNEWALTAVELGYQETAQLLYSKRVFMMLAPPVSAASAAWLHGAACTARAHAGAGHTAAAALHHRLQQHGRTHAERLPRRSANSTQRANTSLQPITRHSADPAYANRHAGTGSPTPLARVTPSHAAVLKSYHAPASLAAPSTAPRSSAATSAHPAASCSLAMPSMAILQRNSRNLGPNSGGALGPGAGALAGTTVAPFGASGLSTSGAGQVGPLSHASPNHNSSLTITATVHSAQTHPSPVFNAAPALASVAHSFAPDFTHPEEGEGLQEQHCPLADVHYIDDAALRNACHAGRGDMVRMLLEQGADVHARDGLPLALAAGGGHLALVESLIDVAGANVQAGGNKALAAAIASNKPAHLQVLSLLLAKGAQVHSADNFALRWACSHGRVEVAQLLLKHGADVHAGVEDALYQAAKNGHQNVVRLLLAHGADPARCQDAILRAEERGHKQVAALLRAATLKRRTRMLSGLLRCFAG